MPGRRASSVISRLTGAANRAVESSRNSGRGRRVEWGMPARRLLPFLAAALVLALLPAADADARKAKRKLAPCTARGDVTLNRNTVARVYEVEDDDTHSVYGCMYDTRKRRLLASWFSCGCSTGDETAPTVWLSGRFVAVTRQSCPPPGVGACTGSLRVIDLRTGATIHGGGYPSELLLKRNGSIAYVVGTKVIVYDAKGVRTVD